MRLHHVACCLLMLACFAGCSSKSTSTDGAAGSDQATPSFILAWSEYPSWSVFDVANKYGIINKSEGEMGPVEKKWGVDIVLKESDYDTCINLYGTSQIDAVCITNMDILSPAVGRESVAIMPTSTSDGADAVITVGIDDVEGLKGKASYGLEKSVSQYMFERNLEILGKDPTEFPFKNMDPAAAAQAMQTNQENMESIVVWNPFVLQTLRTRDDSKTLFDSSSIPEEIIDMVVMGRDSLSKPGGDDFACAVIETFYEVSKRLADPDKGDETLVSLGEKFSSLPLEDMKIVVEQTKFYKTPDAALALFGGQTFQNETMPKVVKFCVDHDICASEPTVAFGGGGAQLDFDPAYILKVQAMMAEPAAAE
jgi:ABC-type nitrate/sulfonate/bicarbonate transport system substrate-binding protein